MTRTGRITYYVMGAIAAVAILSFAPTARSLTNDTSAALVQGSGILAVIADAASEIPSLDAHPAAPTVLPAAPLKAPSTANVVPCVEVQTSEMRCLPGRRASPVKHLHEVTEAEPPKLRDMHRRNHRAQLSSMSWRGQVHVYGQKLELDSWLAMRDANLLSRLTARDLGISRHS